MNSDPAQSQDGVLKRILLLNGLYSLLSNAFLLVGYYLLPEGLLRESPLTFAGEIAAKPEGFWAQFGLTLLFNLGLVTVVSMGANLQRVRGIPMGYFVLAVLGVVGGLVTGTDSYVADDLSRYTVLEGMALGLSIGGVEMLAYTIVIASTVKFGIYQYRSLADWKPTRVMSLRDVGLSKQEMLCLVVCVLLLIWAAYRETVLAISL
jgi:hypothetical protein